MKWIVWTIVVIGLSCLAWLCYRALNPPFRVVERSDSPSGHYRCLVLEKVPALIGEGSYRYRCQIVTGKSEKIIPGKPLDFSTDSLTEGPIHINWSADDAVTVTAPIHGSTDCTIVDGGQRWSEERQSH